MSAAQRWYRFFWRAFGWVVIFSSVHQTIGAIRVLWKHDEAGGIPSFAIVLVIAGEVWWVRYVWREFVSPGKPLIESESGRAAR